MTPTENSPKTKNPMYWLVYLSLFLSGVLLLADAFDATFLNRWTAKWGIVLIFTAIALILANGRKSGFIAVGIIWIAVIGSYLI